MKKKLLAFAVVPILLCATAFAQNYHRWTFDVGGGFSPLVGDIGSRLDNGWNITAGGGYNFSKYFSATLNYTYNGFGVSRFVLNEAAVPNGNAHLWSITVDPKLRLPAWGRFTPYVVGGVGYFRRVVQFTQPALTPVTFYDPFFGYFYNTVVPANQVLGSISNSGPGGSLGAGFSTNIGDSGFKFFTEARYKYASTGHIPVRMIPLTFGIRW